MVISLPIAKVQWPFSAVVSLQLFSFENQVNASLSRFDELQLIQSIL